MTASFLSEPLAVHEFLTECDCIEHLRSEHDEQFSHHDPRQSHGGKEKGDIYELEARQGKRAYGVSTSNQHLSHHSATGLRRHSFNYVRALIFLEMLPSNTWRASSCFSIYGWAFSFNSCSMALVT